MNATDNHAAKRCCGTCKLWGTKSPDTRQVELRLCQFDTADLNLPFWATVDYGNHANWTAADDGRVCETYARRASLGPKVMIHHDREFRALWPVSHHVATSVRGRTIVVIWDGDDRHVGFSYCSLNDQFDRAKGRLIAMNRAMALGRRVMNERYAFTFKIDDNTAAKRMLVPTFMYVKQERPAEVPVRG